jgi:hypothetical protein
MLTKNKDQNEFAKTVGIKPTILKKLEPRYNPNATRAVYLYGPYKLPPSNVRKNSNLNHTNGIRQNTQVLAFQHWVLNLTPTVILWADKLNLPAKNAQHTMQWRT